ncbi:MAG: response regulator [Pseudomonadota bacterium]|jgi:CheY-like chemotaxis protein|nr:response regulator [Pseudomonadota bacterium]
MPTERRIDDLTFLVVDDLETMRHVTINQLRLLGAGKILAAHNGQEGLKLLRQHKVDVVLADLNMPLMDGLDLLKAIRADAKLRSLPVIMITSSAERDRVGEVIAAGVTSLLVKPYSQALLETRVARAMTWTPPAPRAQKATAPATSLVTSTNAASKALATPTEAPARPLPRVLVLADVNADWCANLPAQGFRLKVTAFPAELLDIAAAEEHPNLVVLDCAGTGANPYAMLQKLRDLPSTEEAPVVLLEDSAQPLDVSRLEALGPVDVLDRTAAARLLRLRLHNLLHGLQLRDSLQLHYDRLLETAQLQEDVEQIIRQDIKSPLSTVVTQLQTLLEDRDLSHRQVATLRAIEQGSLHAMNLINLSAELFKIETGRFVLDAKPVPIVDLLRRIAEIDRVSYASRQLTIAVLADEAPGRPPLLARGDATLCYSIFENLLRNACEAAPAGARIEIEVERQDALTIRISNPGAVPPTLREHFFDRFEPATDGKTGLGIYSARVLARAQGGDVALEVSDAADRTTLIIRLPLLD